MGSQWLAVWAALPVSIKCSVIDTSMCFTSSWQVVQRCLYLWSSVASFHHVQPGQSLLKEHWTVHAPNMKLNRQPATRALRKTGESQQDCQMCYVLLKLCCRYILHKCPIQLLEAILPEILPGQSILRQQQVICVQSPKQDTQPPVSTSGKHGKLNLTSYHTRLLGMICAFGQYATAIQTSRT